MFLFSYCCRCVFFFFKQKTAYEMRISDWSSDVCSSDLEGRCRRRSETSGRHRRSRCRGGTFDWRQYLRTGRRAGRSVRMRPKRESRSEEHTSELQSLMRISYAGFCLKKKNKTSTNHYTVVNIHTHR